MAYELYYTAHFTNEQSQSVEISIYKKDAAPPGTVENYEVTKCETTDTGDDEEEGKYNCLIWRELLLSFDVREGQSLTWETFIDAEHDTWKVIVSIDGEYYFHGFITPDEGNAPFQDKPYDVNIRATNGMRLLKDVPLVDVNGEPFDGDHALIEYIAGALKQTGLDLPIRIYCGYFHASMLNKASSLDLDMFQQTDLNYRTFQKDPTTFVSCFDALLIIFNKFCTGEYWNGMWLFSSIAEKQYTPSGDRYNVDYDADGNVIGGNIDTRNYGRIGKQMEIYPINETQSIYARFAAKTVNTRYMYHSWPEMPKNNKFERGTQIGTGTDIDGNTYKDFDVPDWEQGNVDLFDVPHPVITPSTPQFFRRSTYNAFGVEINREIIGETDPADDGNHAQWLRSEGLPVNKGGKIRFTIDKRFDNDFGDPTDFVFTRPAVIYLVVGSTAYYLDIENGGSTGSGLNLSALGSWNEAANLGGELALQFPPGSDTREYASLTAESEPIPHDGMLYIALAVNGPIGTTGTNQYHKNINLEYLPFIADGYIQVRGDMWARTQTATFPDVVDEEVNISDSRIRILKGALLFNDQLTDPAWYRHGPVSTPNILSESRHFKELLNIGRYNHAYRRMYALEGDFNGLNWAPENDDLIKRPIGFFWMYREVDMAEPRDFVLVPPLKMDLIRGWINVNLVEVKKDSNDGTQEGTAEFKYIF